VPRAADLAIAAGLILFAKALWFWLIPRYVGIGDQAILPSLAALAIGALGCLIMVSRLVTRSPQNVGDDPFVEIGGGEPGPIVLLAVVWTCFVAALGLVGFYVGGAIALVASFLVLSVRRPIAIAAWTVGSLLFVHIVFERALSLRLPRGAWQAWLG
jgi:hypothetical protein